MLFASWTENQYFSPPLLNKIIILIILLVSVLIFWSLLQYSTQLIILFLRDASCWPAGYLYGISLKWYNWDESTGGFKKCWCDYISHSFMLQGEYILCSVSRSKLRQTFSCYVFCPVCSSCRKCGCCSIIVSFPHIFPRFNYKMNQYIGINAYNGIGHLCESWLKRFCAAHRLLKK